MTRRTGKLCWALLTAVAFAFLLPLTLWAEARTPEAMTTERIAALGKYAVVHVLHRQKDGSTSRGSGFQVGGPGLVVTCWHLFDSHSVTDLGVPERTWVVFEGGATSEATVDAVDTVWDIALLRLASKKGHALQLAKASPAIGSDVVTIGYPGSAGARVVTKGIVSSQRYNGSVFQTDAALNPGSSGGPVLDTRGEVVGVAFAKLVGHEGAGLMISADQIRRSFAFKLHEHYDACGLIDFDFYRRVARSALDEGMITQAQYDKLLARVDRQEKAKASTSKRQRR